MNPFITQGMIMFILLFLYTLYLWLHTCHFSFLDFYLDIILYMRLLQISSRMSPVHQSEAWMENVRGPVQKSGIAWNIQNDIFNIELYWYRINTDPQKCVWCSPVSKNCNLCVTRIYFEPNSLWHSVLWEQWALREAFRSLSLSDSSLG